MKAIRQTMSTTQRYPDLLGPTPFHHNNEEKLRRGNSLACFLNNIANLGDKGPAFSSGAYQNYTANWAVQNRMSVTLQAGDRTWNPKCYGPFKAGDITIKIKGTIGSSQSGARYTAVLAQPKGAATRTLEELWKGIGIIPVEYKDFTEGIHISTEAGDYTSVQKQARDATPPEEMGRSITLKNELVELLNYGNALDDIPSYHEKAKLFATKQAVNAILRNGDHFFKITTPISTHSFLVY